MVGPAEQMSINSGEAVTVDTRDAEPTPEKLVGNSSVEQVNPGSNAVVDHLRKSALVRGAGFNGMLAAGQSRELQDADSLEGDAGRPSQVTDHRQEADYDGKNLLSYNLLGCIEIIFCGFQYPPQNPENFSVLKHFQEVRKIPLYVNFVKNRLPLHTD